MWKLEGIRKKVTYIVKIIFQKKFNKKVSFIFKLSSYNIVTFVEELNARSIRKKVPFKIICPWNRRVLRETSRLNVIKIKRGKFPC